MRALIIIAALTLSCFVYGEEAYSQSVSFPGNISTEMAVHGPSLIEEKGIPTAALDGFTNEIPTGELSKFVRSPITESFSASRGTKDVQLYRAIAPSVVLIANKEGFGSGSLVDTAGDILTNWHVVNGYEFLGVIFKPSVEGKEPTRDDVKVARVVKYDQIADLALIKLSDVPTGRTPIHLADPSEIAVGTDVHAIGHPEGETWTYTTGVISQYRQGYPWQESGDPTKHKADVVQTQTPINPGNSGGPLLSDGGNLLGVNTFKDSKAEGLNFAVSVDEVRRFLARSGDRIAHSKRNHSHSKVVR